MSDKERMRKDALERFDMLLKETKESTPYNDSVYDALRKFS